MISTSNFKIGITIIVNGEPYTIIWFQNHKPGKGGAIIRVKLQHFINKGFIERTFKSGEKFIVQRVISEKKQFLYKDNINNYNFIDMSTYEQIVIPTALLGKKINFLKEGTEIEVKYLNDKLVSVELPVNVELTIKEAECGLKGNSAVNMTKIVKLETGFKIRVPLFIKKGDIVKIDTRNGKYIERVNKIIK
ncbi:MAG: elongation factor P [Endomicrobium sp.]|jgi:elongation factor P|nr:elongation factor P [Endomicrobium sp.]